MVPANEFQKFQPICSHIGAYGVSDKELRILIQLKWKEKKLLVVTAICDRYFPSSGPPDCIQTISLNLIGTKSGDLEQVHSNALQIVADYGSIVRSLEVKRIADSRVGFAMWEERWRFYQPESPGLTVSSTMLAFGLILFLRGLLPPAESFFIYQLARSVARISKLGDQGKIRGRYNTASKT